MKYFTEQLLSDGNSDNASISDKAEKQWNRNVKAYWKYIAKILPELPPQARKFFGKTSLHDGMIVSISIGNLDQFFRSATASRTSCVKIRVVHPESGNLYTLHYSWLRDFRIDYHVDRCYREKYYYIFEDWGYDELFLTRDKWMRHEIRLFSDTTILLEFKHFSYKVEKIKGKRAWARLYEDMDSR